jgi:hypothetical protein
MYFALSAAAAVLPTPGGELATFLPDKTKLQVLHLRRRRSRWGPG